jgi:enamine deaminase RidA (YjgF/YER057c/UK114 family)
MASHIAPVTPAALERPLGYAHGVEIRSGRLLFIAGQVARDRNGTMQGKGDLVAQFRQVCENIRHVVTAAGGSMSDIVKLNIYVLDAEEYKRRLEPIGAVYREYFGKHFPAMTLAGVRELYVSAEGGLIEIEGVAALP